MRVMCIFFIWCTGIRILSSFWVTEALKGKWQKISDTSLFSSLFLSYSSDSSFILNLGDFKGFVPATSLASGSSGFGADSKA